MVTFDTSEWSKLYLMQIFDISGACEISSITEQIVKNQVKSALCFEFLWNNFISEKCAITREFGQRIFFLPVRSVKLRDQGRDAEISGKIVQPKAFPLVSNLQLITRNLSDLCLIEIKRQVIGRFLHLFDQARSRESRLRIIIDEIRDLWTKPNFSIVSSQIIMAKLKELVVICQRRRKKAIDKDRNNVRWAFWRYESWWKLVGNWWAVVREADRDAGWVGYTTERTATGFTVHALKRMRRSGPTVACKMINNSDEICERFSISAVPSDFEDEIYINEESDNETKPRKHSSVVASYK